VFFFFFFENTQFYSWQTQDSKQGLDQPDKGHKPVTFGS